MKQFLCLATLLILLLLVVPSFTVLIYNNERQEAKSNDDEILLDEKETNKIKPQTINVSVYRSKSDSIQEMDLEDYVKGVLASEMPINFEKEALKAQAVVARTYIINKLLNKQTEKIPNGADITDTVSHQVYKSPDELKEEWGKNYISNMQIISNASQETEGVYIEYNNQPIEASFFASSNGYTENSEEYWAAKIPYLRSVDSPWDVKSDKFYDEKKVSINEFEKKLGIDISKKLDVKYQKSQGKRNMLVTINGKRIKGIDIRVKFNLRSTDFEIFKKNGEVIFKTKGSGHGVGLSQYGAHYQAMEGKDYREIINYYYKGVSFNSVNKIETLLVSK